jgi:filamentous hemagglutinin family protein
LAGVSAITLAGATGARPAAVNPFARATNAAQQVAASANQSQASTSAAQKAALAALSAARQIRTQMEMAQSQARAALRAGGSAADGLGRNGLSPTRGGLWTGALLPTQSTDGSGAYTVTVDQKSTGSSKAILTWDSFNVGANTTLNFLQNASSDVVLNRVLSTPGVSGPSQILGSIHAIGKVFILNQNGILFGGKSQVNVGSLIAAGAKITDDQFNTFGVFSGAKPTLTDLTGQVIVAAGAKLSTPKPSSDSLVRGGYIALMGTEVDNRGAISTPSGQTLLAAGDQVWLRQGFDPKANARSTTLGIEAAPVFLSSGASSGAVTNSGMIEADTGDITLAGRAVAQNGSLLSTSTTQQRGTIHLLTSASDAQSSVTFGAGSVTQILPDIASTVTATDAQRLALLQKSGFNTNALAPFDDLSALADRPDLGRIEVVTGGLVDFKSGSLTLANGGQIAVQAGLKSGLLAGNNLDKTSIAQTGKIEVEAGAVLDVSGVQDVQKSVTDNFISINVQPYDLRDAPVNRDAKTLVNQNLWVDTRNLTYVAAGVGGAPSPRAYTAGGLLEVSGYLANQAHGIGDWASVGGAVTLSAGTVETKAQSTINLAGGYLSYQGGQTPQSLLLGADGKIYTANSAPANLQMLSLGRTFDVAHPRWGKAYEKTYASAFGAPKGSSYEAGYVVQRDGGALIVSAQTAVLNGDIAAQGGAQGARQTQAHPTYKDPATKAPAPIDPYAVGALAYNATQAKSKTNAAFGVAFDQAPTSSPDSYQLRQNIVARAGGLFILPAQQMFFIDPENPDAPQTYGQGVGPSLLGSAVNLAPGGGTVPATDNVITLDPTVLSRGGLGALSVKTSGGASLAGALTLSPGGAAQILAGGVTLDGALAAPSGSITLSGLAYDGTSYTYAPVTLKSGAQIDTRGLVTNQLIDPGLTGGPAYINGGAVNVTGAGLILNAGSGIDASAGASISASGAFKGGNGGDITLTNDNEAVAVYYQTGAHQYLFNHLQPFLLDASLRSQGFVKGGALTITGAGPVVIADLGSAQDAFVQALNATHVLKAGQSAPGSLLLAQDIVVKAGQTLPFTWTDASDPTLPADKDAVFNMPVVLQGAQIDPNDSTIGFNTTTQQDWTVAGPSPVIVLNNVTNEFQSFSPGQKIPKGKTFNSLYISAGTTVPLGTFDTTVHIFNSNDSDLLPVNSGTTYLAGSVASKDLTIPAGAVIPKGLVYSDVAVAPVMRLAPSFFASGFSKYAISALGGLTVAPGTQIDVVQPILAPPRDLLALSNGPLTPGALATTLPPLFTVNSKTGQVVQRAGVDISLTTLSLSKRNLPPLESSTLDYYYYFLLDNPEINVGLGARIEVDPGRAILLQGPGQQTIDGALIAPSGTISLTTTAKDVPYYLGDNAPYRSIWLGASSLLDAAGRSYGLSDAAGRPVVAWSNLSGGKVVVGSAEVAKYQTTPLFGSLHQAVDFPFVVTAPGSRIDVSGRPAPIPSSQVPSSQAGDAGSVTFASNVGLVLNGSVNAFAGGAGAAGGQLRVIQEGLGLIASYDQFFSSSAKSIDSNQIRYVIPSEIVFDPPTGATLTPTAPTLSSSPDDFQAKTWLGTTHLDAGAFAKAGFTRLDFLARDAFVFNGSIDLSAAQSLVLERGVIGEPVANAHVTLSAPYLRLLGNAKPYKSSSNNPKAKITLPAYFSSFTPFDAFSNELPPIFPSLSRGSVLTLQGGLIDLAGEVTFGGIESLSLPSNLLISRSDDFMPSAILATYTLPGFQNIVMKSASDIRIIPGNFGASEQNTNPNYFLKRVTNDYASMWFSGDLTLEAQRLYLTGYYLAEDQVRFNVQVQGVLKIKRIDASTPTTPLTYGGQLALTASAIYDDGVIWQPFGRITFNGPTTFQPHSYTSVSGLGLTAPLGGTSDGINYTALGASQTSLGQLYSSGGLVGIYEFAYPAIALNSNSVTVQKGAVLDLRGGGTLLGEGFVRGKGGSVDVFTAPYATDPATGAVVTTGAAASTLYALVPGTQAPVSPITVSGQASGADPLGYSTVTIPAGVPGLAAGTYTLLPADYALAPGAYRVQLGAQVAPGQAGGVVSLSDGSYAVNAQLGVLGGVGAGQAVSVILSSGDVVRRHATYNEETPDAFMAAWANSLHIAPFLATGARNSAYPYLTRDAGSLSLVSAAGDAPFILDYAGQALFTPAPGGALGGVSIDLTNSVKGTYHPLDACLYAGAAGSDCNGLNIDVNSLNAIAAPSLTLTAANITFEENAVLKAGAITLNANPISTDASAVQILSDEHLTFKQGAGLDTTGGATPAADQGVFITVGYDGSISGYPVATNGVLTLESRALLQTQGPMSFTLNGLGGVTLDPTARVVAGDLVLQSNVVSLGDGGVPQGLHLSQGFIDRLAGRAGESVTTNHLTLIARSGISFAPGARLDLGLGSGKILTLETGALLGAGADADTAIIAADTVEWYGGPSGGTGLPRYQQTPTSADGPGSGTGQLNINARVLRLGGVAPTVSTDPNVQAPFNAGHATPAAQETLGFSNVALNAASVIRFVGPGSLDVFQSQDVFGQPGTGGNLTLSAPRIVTAPAEAMTVAAGGRIVIAASGASSSATSADQTPGLGGSLSFSGDSIEVQGVLRLPSGRLTLTAQNGVTLGAQSVLDLSGTNTPILDQKAPTAGGVLTLSTVAGDIRQYQGSIIDVSAPGASAGSMSFSDMAGADQSGGGAVDLQGTLLGSAPKGFMAAGFSLSAKTLTNFADLNARLNAGGVFGGRAFDIGTGDLTVSSGVKAHSVSIAVDGGHLTIDGVIDASGGSAGQIRLAGTAGLTLTSNAVLDAHGDVLAVDSRNLPITASNTSLIMLTGQTGPVALNSGARLDVRSADGVARGDIEINAPRIDATGAIGTLAAETYGDVALRVQSGVTVLGAASLAVNALQSYKLDTLTADYNITSNTNSNGHINYNIDQALLDKIDVHSQSFIRNASSATNLQTSLANLNRAAPGVTHLRPGVLLTTQDAAADLSILDDIDLSGYRYGPGAKSSPGAGEPGVLQIRAGGNLYVYGSVTDGFVTSTANPLTQGAFATPDALWVMDFYLPSKLVLAAGSRFPTGVTYNYDLPLLGTYTARNNSTYDNNTYFLALTAGQTTPVRLTLTQDATAPSDFITTANIRDAGGHVLYARGQKVPKGTVLAANDTVDPGFGGCPTDLLVGDVMWPKGAPLTLRLYNQTYSQYRLHPIYTDFVAAGPFTLSPGAFIPASYSWSDENSANNDVYLNIDPARNIIDNATLASFLTNFSNNTEDFALLGHRAPGDTGIAQQRFVNLLGAPLPAGALSWSLQFVSGADLAAADPRATVAGGGALILSDPHTMYGPLPPSGDYYIQLGASAIRTGAGRLDLQSGQDIIIASPYGIYTAGTPDADSAPVPMPRSPQSLTYVMQGGGDVSVAARQDVAEMLLTFTDPFDVGNLINKAPSRNLKNSAAPGHWLWLSQSPTDGKGAWTLNFGWQDSKFALQTFIGIGALGGGNVNLSAGGDVGAGAGALNIGQEIGVSAGRPYAVSGLNIAVGASGEYVNGAWRIGGGGDLNIAVGGQINPDWSLTAGSQPLSVPLYLKDTGASNENGATGGLFLNLRGPSQVRAAGFNFASIAPGDGAFSVTVDRNLWLAAVVNPGFAQSADWTFDNGFPFQLPPDQFTAHVFNLWTDATTLSATAGGDMLVGINKDADFNMDGFNTRFPPVFSYVPGIVSLLAPTGSVFFPQNTTELLPNPVGRLTLLAGGNILSISDYAHDNPLNRLPISLIANNQSYYQNYSVLAMSGADPSAIPSPDHPLDVHALYNGAATDVDPYADSLMFAYGPDTASTRLHTGDRAPNHVYAAGDIAGVAWGMVFRSCLVSGACGPLQTIGGLPTHFAAGRDIIDSGLIDNYNGYDVLANPGLNIMRTQNNTTNPESFYYGPTTATIGLFAQTDPGDVSVVKAGRDLTDNRISVIGAGVLSIEAGRNLFQTGGALLSDSGGIRAFPMIESLGPLMRGVQDLSSGPAISLTVGAGAAGPDYAGFAAAYLSSGKTGDAYRPALYDWMRSVYGYTGTEADSLTAFQALLPAQQAVFLRQVFYQELVASGRDYTDPTSVRYGSYKRGKDAIASLFPTRTASGAPITYDGSLTLFQSGGATGVVTDYGGSISVLAPGGGVTLGQYGVQTTGAAGLITAGSGDIDIFAQGSILLGASRVFTTYGGNIAMWSQTGDINAGIGAKSISVAPPVNISYTPFADVIVSPSVPTEGAGIATLAPVPSVPPGDVDLVAPLGVVDAGDAGIRVSGNVNIAALAVVNAANIQVTGKARGLPVVAAVNTGALTAAAAQSQSAVSGFAASEEAKKKKKKAPRNPFSLVVRLLGYGD